MKTLKHPESKTMLAEAVMLTDAVDESSKSIRRTEFPREKLPHVKAILKMLRECAITIIKEENIETPEQPFVKELDYQSFNALTEDEKKNLKVLGERFNDTVLNFDGGVWKTAKYYLEAKTHWKLISDEALEEINIFLAKE